MTETTSEEDMPIRVGSVIDSRTANYVVVSKIGEGGFGAVYRVHLEGDKSKEYAIKVERKKEGRKHSKLKMEIAILKSVSTTRADRNHFTKIIDRGKKTSYFFVVMQLVGKSLSDLKAARPNKVFSIGTALGVAIQCLEAVEDLHTHGFIHRDIKPANYACGRDAHLHVIYILDFGIARKIVKATEELKTPREVVGFKGTIPFAPIACHRREDLSKKDDCESWFYLLLDITVSTGLPWRRFNDKNRVRDCKVNARKEGSHDFEKMYNGLTKCRAELVKIINYIDSLTYPETPDYEFIYNMLREAAKVQGVNPDDLFDWELDDTMKTKIQLLKG